MQLQFVFSKGNRYKLYKYIMYIIHLYNIINESCYKGFIFFAFLSSALSAHYYLTWQDNRSYFFQYIYFYLLNRTRRYFYSFMSFGVCLYGLKTIYSSCLRPGKIWFDKTVEPLPSCKHYLYTYIYTHKWDLYLYLIMMQSNNIFPIRLYIFTLTGVIIILCTWQYTICIILCIIL
jgi:hypothetical protein